MEHRARPKRVVRAARWVVFSVLAIGAGACAAILGIEDREPVDATTQTEGGDAPSAIDGGSDGPQPGDALVADVLDANDPTKTCDASACAAADGSCINGSCALSCSGACADTTFKCPPGLDCTVGCTAGNSCDNARCVGGRSCTFDCSGTGSCKHGVACESTRCEFLCGSTDSCKDGIVSCDASVCVALCKGKDSCNDGVLANATESCSISCTGVPSCNKNVPLLCTAPDASIFCGLGTDVCKGGKPSCASDKCTIECRDKTGCSNGFCCDAGTCNVTIEAGTGRSCP